MVKSNGKAAMKIVKFTVIIAIGIFFAWGVVYADGNVKANPQISVKVAGKEKSGKTITMDKGKKITLIVSVPSVKGKISTKYRSSDKKVVSVTKKGKLTAKKKGTAKIRITVKGIAVGKQSASVTIKVRAVSGNKLSIQAIPKSYSKTIKKSGKIEKVDYKTKTYNAANKTLSKYAYVYVPYGYDKSKKYNIIYLLHGGGGNAERYFNGVGKSSEMKHILDHMIADGKIKPTIVVTPTFYPIGNTDDSVATAGEQVEKFHRELVNDLIPTVEGTYSTYAKSTDTKGLKASREHRAFGGFSMGSVATWYQFIQSMDYFKYYLPMSGDCWAVTERGGETRGAETAKYLEDSFKKSGYGVDDFFIYAVTGSEDIAYDPMNGQIKAMKKLNNTFRFIEKKNQAGNICFLVKKGGYHDYPDIREYIYNALPMFWK